MSRQKPGQVKITPISDLEAPVVEDTGIALSDSPAMLSSECSCSCKAITERASGTVILRCPECGLIRDIWRGADQLPFGTYCRWCGLEDLTISMDICADRACHPRRR